MEIESYSVVSPSRGQKQYAIYANGVGVSSPLIYLQKPKWVPATQWDEIVSSVSLRLPKGYRIGTARTDKGNEG